MMEDLVTRFGLWAVFLGSTVEGDLMVILGGVSAHLGLMKLPAAMAAGAAGCLAGDLAWYAVGRFRADAIRDTRLHRRFGAKVEALADRLGPWQILAARAVYGTRNLTMLLWGVRKLPFARFLLTDVVGCALWGVLLGGLGYLASGGAAALLGEVKRVELWLLGAAVATAIGLVVARRVQRGAGS
jgi:membrane protein DedA with SNARE-associated domain